jgi:NAD(P)-dependent dehydrogenase (short-subunit alcohol dehydrogenase family)
MTKLVTGGTGFIGAAVAGWLVERGEDVVPFYVVPNAHRFDGIKDHVKFVQGDLKVWPEIFNAVKGNHDGIYHLGAMLSLPSEANPWASFQVNVMGTMYILEAARLLDVEAEPVDPVSTRLRKQRGRGDRQPRPHRTDGRVALSRCGSNRASRDYRVPGGRGPGPHPAPQYGEGAHQ